MPDLDWGPLKDPNSVFSSFIIRGENAQIKMN